MCYNTQNANLEDGTMKKWSVILVFVLLVVCLFGCGKQEVIPGRPYALEVTYGEKSIHAVTGGYAWNWKERGKVKTVTTDAVDPRAVDQRLTYLATGEGDNMALDFAILPDKLTVEVFSADDGFATAQPVELKNLTFPAPLDGQDHLFSVTAQWNENKYGWGSCTYHFRFVDRALDPTAPVISDIGNLNLSKIMAMNADDFMGIEFTNYIDDAVKTCRSGKDKETIVDYLKNNLPAEMTPSEAVMTETMYALRMVTLDGSQLTLCFGTDGRNACLQAGGVLYPLQPTDLSSLWEALGAGSVSAAAAASGKGYLDVSKTYPMEDWLSEPIFAYITSLDNGNLTYDEMRQFESQDSPTGYRYERGWSDMTMSVAADCQYWVLDEDGTYGKVTAEGLLQWMEHTENDVLFCIYTGENAVTAICPQLAN